MGSLIMNSYRQSIFAMLFIMIAIAGCNKDGTSDKFGINGLSHAEEYKLLINKYANINLCEIDSPREIALYIEALIESGRQLPAAFQKSACPLHIREFALGYYAMQRGQLNDCLPHFTAIRGSTTATIWTSIAFLEYALYTEDFSKYEMFLRILKEIASQDDAPNANNLLLQKALPYYEGRYLFLVGKVADAKKLLIEKSAFFDPVEKSIMEIEICLRNDEFDTAEKLIDAQLKKYPTNQKLLDSKGELIRLSQGDDFWVAYLKKVIAQYPKMWIIESNYAMALIELGQKEKGLELLERIANRRLFDYEINLVFADYSLLYGKPSEMGKVQNILNNKHYIQLPYYHIILARIYYFNGDTAKMEDHLRIAKALNPYADYVLWFEFDVLSKSKKYEEAGSVMDNILKLWPNDINALYEKYAIAVKQKDRDEIQKIGKMILNSKRYVPSKYIDEINSTKEKQ